MKKRGSHLKVTISYNTYLSNQQFEVEEIEDDPIPSVPICGSNLSTPVVDKAYYINEIHYSLGGRMYIENAD